MCTHWHEPDPRSRVCIPFRCSSALSLASCVALHRSFYTKLPLQQLHGLRRLSLENVKVFGCSKGRAKSSNLKADKATPAGAAHPTLSDDKTPSSGSAQCVGRGGQDDPDRRGGRGGTLVHLTHLHTDSSFLSLVRALEGPQLQLLGSLEVLRITLGPRDSEFVGSYLARAGDAAFQALCSQCTRLRKLLLGTAYVTPEGLKHVGLVLTA